jgi:hypothetical protein
MKKIEPRLGRLGLGLILTGSITAGCYFLPIWQQAEAVGRKDKNGTQAAQTDDKEKLPNYDIRLDKKAFETVAAFRNSMKKSASAVADIRDGFATAEVKLRSSVPSLKVEYNEAMCTPEVISPDVEQGKKFLTSPSSEKRSDKLKGFLKQNKDLVAAADRDVDDLKVVADYTNPDGNLSFTELSQEIDGIPVFQGRVRAGFTKKGELIRVVNNLAPGVENSPTSTDFGDPANAVSNAFKYIDAEDSQPDLVKNEAASNELRTIFGPEDSGITVDKTYFPTEPGVVIPAWQMVIWQPQSAFYVVIDAQSGNLLWRKNIVNDQNQPATYDIYANPNAMINVARSPFPMSPGQASPNGVQATGINRTLVTLVGNEAPYTFNSLGWITDGQNTTDGNNVQAGLDRESPNQGGSGDIDPNGTTTGVSRVFDFPLNPGIPTNPAQSGGDSPLPASPAGQVPSTCLAAGQSIPSDYQKAVVTQLFYLTNRYHDELYRLGFTEQAGNFQQNNFGRGGLGNDRISAQAQDCLGVNNANFGTPPDGFRPTMQMFLFSAPTPDFDGSLDADVVVHELTHGVSNRLHGNAAGLIGSMGGAMGEGWSDFYAMALMSQPSDPVEGVYPMGGYTTYRLRGGSNEFNNYYYGIRRFPYAIMSATGGPSARPHNPLTFADIDATKIDISDGAFTSTSFGSADEVHRAGEIWGSALWEVRAKFIQRLGWAVGNRLVLQLVTDGMKLAPSDPTFLSERDAIIAAALASGTADDVKDIWSGFAIRGMGANARVDNLGDTGGGQGRIRVTESFDLPNLTQAPSLTFSDATGDNDGIPEPGETVRLTIPLTNNTGNAATGVTLQIAGGSSANYGTIAHQGAASEQINFTVPANAACGGVVTLTLNINSSLGPTVITRTLVVGTPNAPTLTENFDGVSVPAIPGGWAVASTYAPMAFVTTPSVPDSAPNSVFAADLPSCTGSGCSTTDGGETTLTSPSFAVSSQAARLTFRHRFNTELGFDGGVLEIKIGSGDFQDIIAAGGTFLQSGYNVAIYQSPPNPLGTRMAWTGNSGGYITTIAQLPVSAAGQSVQLRWRFGADSNTAPAGGGWNIDSIQVATTYSCSLAPTAKRVRADFDGDGKTDLSVFRPTEGNWYLVQSSGGIAIRTWGAATDQLAPGDYDGDGKTDFAVFRPGANPSYFIFRSNGFVIDQFSWGIPGDKVMTGDYDGDGKDDATVYRPSNNNWYIRTAGGGLSVAAFGAAGDVPVTGDYNGDGKSDFGVFRNGQWIIGFNGGGFFVTDWGEATDKPVPADYDGDGREDIAVYRPSNGNWYIRRSTNSQFDIQTWGIATDIPVPGDYDGDGKYDLAVYRSGTWYLKRSSLGINISDWGVTTDIPIPSKYVP